MAKILQLLCLIAITSAQLDFEDDEPEDLLDNSLTREVSSYLFGDSKRTITIYSDFDNPNDRFFFQNILPWLVDNIGNYLRINYRFRNSARSSGPRACALRALRSNTYLQAEFLRCEAQGNSVSSCVDQAPINKRSYDRCLNRRINGYVRNSQTDFDRIVSDRSPIVLVGNRRELITTDPRRLLRLLCQEFGRLKPTGCVGPLALPRTIIRSTLPALTNLEEVRSITRDIAPIIDSSATNIVAVSDFITTTRANTVTVAAATTKQSNTFRPSFAFLTTEPTSVNTAPEMNVLPITDSVTQFHSTQPTKFISVIDAKI